MHRFSRLNFAGGGFRPSLAIFPILARDLLLWSSGENCSKRAHLEATMDWLCCAQDQIKTGGISAGFSLLRGWLAPYPETTGYLIPTFFDYAHFAGKEEFCDRACAMADWELELQFESGAVQGGEYYGETGGRHPAVFDTGQVILGWCRAFEETADHRYLDAALRAGNWLVSVQIEDGSWPTPCEGPHGRAYDVRTAWALLELNRLSGVPTHLHAARAAIEWTLSQQNENAWFNRCAFNAGPRWPNLPFTHCIAYVIEGLLAAWEYLGDERCWHAAAKTTDQLLAVLDSYGFLPGELDATWHSDVTYRCLSGDAQVAAICVRIHSRTGEVRYLSSARLLNNEIKKTQITESRHKGVRGGVRGSQPIAGPYAPFTFVNWGAKFFADSLMLELQSGIEAS
jgi:hypothetical protein